MKILLIIIYLAFISLGLPDSLLGSAWPAMRAELGAPVPTAGWLAMTISLGTIISSLFSSKIINRFKTGKVTAVSVAMTAVALFGFAFAPSVWFLFLMAVPLGLGAGSIDAGLNIRSAALQIRPLTGSLFLGIGATVGPMIMAYHIATQNGWRFGYITIAAIQAVLVVVLFASLGLWRNGTGESSPADNNEETRYITNREALRLPNARLAMVGFIFFSATEVTTGLWCSSYLSVYHGFSAADAATVASCFYGGITVGRLISGFISMKVKSPDLMRWGQLTCGRSTADHLAPAADFRCRRNRAYRAGAAPFSSHIKLRTGSQGFIAGDRRAQMAVAYRRHHRSALFGQLRWSSAQGCFRTFYWRASSNVCFIRTAAERSCAKRQVQESE